MVIVMSWNMRRNWTLALVLTAVVSPLAANAQQAKPKGAASSSRSQRQEPMSQTQGVAGQEAEDQILVYRFRLDADSSGSQLLVANSTERAGTITLFAQEADGAISKEVKRTIEPGAVLAISAAEAGWSASNVVSVKASRRLLLSVQFPG